MQQMPSDFPMQPDVWDAIPEEGQTAIVLLWSRVKDLDRELARWRSTKAASEQRATRRLLVVDDSNLLRTAVARMARAHGHEVFEAHNGLQAVTLARKNLPDLIIMDVHMPVLSGVDALAEMRKDPRLRETDVVMLTSIQDPETVFAALQGDVKGYTVKSTIDEVKKRLQEFLDLG